MAKLYIVMERSWGDGSDNVIVVENLMTGIFKKRENAERFIKEAKEKRKLLDTIIVEVESDF